MINDKELELYGESIKCSSYSLAGIGKNYSDALDKLENIVGNRHPREGPMVRPLTAAETMSAIIQDYYRDPMRPQTYPRALEDTNVVTCTGIAFAPGGNEIKVYDKCGLFYQFALPNEYYRCDYYALRRPSVKVKPETCNVPLSIDAALTHPGIVAIIGGNHALLSTFCTVMNQIHGPEYSFTFGVDTNYSGIVPLKVYPSEGRYEFVAATFNQSAEFLAVVE